MLKFCKYDVIKLGAAKNQFQGNTFPPVSLHCYSIPHLYAANLSMSYKQKFATSIQGYLIGNASTDVDYDYNSFVPLAHGMGLISTDMFEVCDSTLSLVSLKALLLREESVALNHLGDG